MRYGRSNLEKIDVDALVHETDKAYLFRIDNKKVWIPKECCEFDEDEMIVEMEHEYALEKELI